MTDTTLCTASECFWQDDCRRHADNNKPNAWQLYRDYSRDVVVKDGVKMPCPYFDPMDKQEMTNDRYT